MANPASPPIRKFASDKELFLALRDEFQGVANAGDLVAVPTGKTPLPLYRTIRGQGSPVWREYRYLQLDEYLSPPPGVERFARFLAREVFDPLGVPAEARLTIPADLPPPEAARHMDETLRVHGPLQGVILGLGSNGHIAFNEPSRSFTAGYHEVLLTRETVRQNFPHRPDLELRALTISVEQILDARHIFLVVPQTEKLSMLERALAGPVDPQVPVSALFPHPGTVVFRLSA